MLDEPEQALFALPLGLCRRRAGWTPSRRSARRRSPVDVLDALGSLVEKSLVRQSEGIGGEPRFGMLGTIREFALEQSTARGGREDLRRRHAELFATLADGWAGRVMAADKGETLDRIEQDHDNLRAAIAWAIETGAADMAMRLGSALWRFWQMRGYLQEGLERLEQRWRSPRLDDHPELRADALDATAGVAYWLGDGDRARDRTTSRRSRRAGP